jgi:type I restriction enzyme S subunit
MNSVRHWPVVPLKRLTTSILDGTHGTHLRLSEGIPLLSAKNVVGGAVIVDATDSRVSREDFERIHRTGYLRRGDVLLTIVGTIGRSAIFDLDYPVAFQRSVASLRPAATTDARFLRYVLESSLVQDALTQQKKQTAQGGIYLSDLSTLPAPYPPPQAQRQIADFLDRETTRIDSLLEKKRAMLARIHLRSVSLIHRAVRGEEGGKRLVDRPDLQWLGPIREDWPTPQMGLIADVYPGVGFPDQYQGEQDGEFPLLKASDLVGASMHDLGIDSGANWISAEVAQKLRGKPAPVGTIVFPRIGAALYGRNRRILGRPALFDNNLVGIRFRDGDPEYWALLLLMLDLGGIAQPGPVPSVSGGQLAAVKVPFPPPEQQGRIVDRVRGRLRLLEILISKIQKQLESIREHRQALITDAISGQIGV